MYETADKLYAVPTAEVPLTNYLRDEILDEGGDVVDIDVEAAEDAGHALERDGDVAGREDRSDDAAKVIGVGTQGEAGGAAEAERAESHLACHDQGVHGGIDVDAARGRGNGDIDTGVLNRIDEHLGAVATVAGVHDRIERGGERGEIGAALVVDETIHDPASSVEGYPFDPRAAAL